MYTIFKNKTSLNYAIALIIYALICTFLIVHFQFDLLTSILLILAGFGIVVLINPLLKPLVKMKYQASVKQQREIDKHIAIAKKANKKSFPMGPEKKHTVWATNFLIAQKIYNLHIAPRVIKNKQKAFYYISETCNNLK